jgi:hypothetical protein
MYDHNHEYGRLIKVQKQLDESSAGKILCYWYDSRDQIRKLTESRAIISIICTEEFCVIDMTVEIKYGN